ncbi:MAG: response regulator transcription factor [Burkholderiales bacterium]|nr:response regulator transcription factor [Burkholderiales bacterium]
MTQPRMRAFLVEDSAAVRDSLIAALDEMAALEVVGWADDEPSTLAWLDTSGNACDILIIDILLRAGSGLGVLRALAGRDAPAERLVFTNHTTPALRHQCLALGASKVFDKSAEIDALIAHCRGLARR